MSLSYIRKKQCKRLFYPLMLLGVVIFLVWRSPVTEYVTKRTISNAMLINDSMAKKVLYAKFADIFTKVMNFRKISSARCVNTVP